MFYIRVVHFMLRQCLARINPNYITKDDLFMIYMSEVILMAVNFYLYCLLSFILILGFILFYFIFTLEGAI